MSPPEQSDKPEIALTKRIEELEFLLNRNKPRSTPAIAQNNGDNQSDRIQGSGNIPVLDELVTAEDYSESDLHHHDVTTGTGANYVALANKLEQKFSEELDQVVDILKDNLKHSIMKELQAQLDEQTGEEIPTEDEQQAININTTQDPHQGY